MIENNTILQNVMGIYFTLHLLKILNIKYKLIWNKIQK